MRRSPPRAQRGAEGDLAGRARPDRRLAGPAARRRSAARGGARQRRDGQARRRRSRASSTPVAGEARTDGERDRPARARAPPGPGRARGRWSASSARASARCARRPATSSSRAEAPLDPRLVGRDPAAQRRRDGGDGLALRLPRAEHDPDGRGRSCDRTCSSTSRRQARGGRLQGPPRRLPVDARGRGRRGARGRTRTATPRQTREHILNSPPRATRTSSTRHPSSSSCSCPPTGSTRPRWPPIPR